MLIPVFAALVIARISVNGYWRKNLIDPFIFLIVWVSLYSAFLNDSKLVNVAFSIGIYLRYPIFFVLLVGLNLPQKEYKRALNLFLIIGLLLIVEVFLNFILLGKNQDGTFFTLGPYGTTAAGVFFIYGSCFVISYALILGTRWYHLATIALVFVAAWIAQIRSAILCIPLLFLLLYATYRHWLNRRYLLLGAILSLCTIFFIVLIWNIPGFKIYGLEFDPIFRIESIRAVLDILSSHNRLLTGLGPRSFSPGKIGPPGKMYTLLLERYGGWYIANVPLSQFVNAFSELGVVGFGIYWIMLLAVLRMNLKFWFSMGALKNPDYMVKRMSIIFLGFTGIWVHYSILGLMYFDFWRMDISSFVFWTLAAAIYAEGRKWALRNRSGNFAV